MAKIGNATTSVNTRQVIHILKRLNTDLEVRERDFSTSPHMMDTSQRYTSMAATVKNPLGAYGDNSAETPRGAFPMVLVANTRLAAQITIDLTDYIYVSPLAFSRGEKSGFYGVQNMLLSFNFSNLQRMWSHANYAGGTLTAVNVTLGIPSVQLKYVSRPLTMPMPNKAILPYYDVQNYITSTSAAVAASAASQIVSQTLVLQSIPDKIVVAVTRRQADRTFLTTDTFFSIEGITVKWNKRSGLLASAPKEELYRMSEKNGCSMSWEEWSGGPTNTMIGGANTAFGTVGSVMVIRPGLDFPLQPDEAPGKNGKYNFQITVNVINKNTAAGVQPQLDLIVISPGTFSVINNLMVPQIGVLTGKDIVTAKKGFEVEYSMMHEGYGGNFFKSFKRFSGTVARKVQQAIKTGKKIAPHVIKAAKVVKDVLPILQEAAPLLLAAGKGKRKKKKAGAFIGGLGMTAAQLKRLASMI